jgi:hypothetical protein
MSVRRQVTWFVVILVAVLVVILLGLRLIFDGPFNHGIAHSGLMR